jgi:hypothetical protein
MALTATFSCVPLRSMPSRITSASSFRASAERTFSFLLTCSWMLGFTSRETTEATALALRQLVRPKAQHTTARAAATARGAQRLRGFLNSVMGITVPFCSSQEARMRSPGSGAACSMAVRSRCSISCSRISMSVGLLPCELELLQSSAVF